MKHSHSSGVIGASRPANNCAGRKRPRSVSSTTTKRASGATFSPAMRPRMAATAAPPRCFNTRKRGDSGSIQMPAIPATTGRMPPMRKITGQPMCGTSVAATSPGKPPPKATPE